MCRQYKLVFILIILIIICYSCFLLFYPPYIQNVEDNHYKQFLAGKSTYQPIKHGVPYYQNVIFYQIDELSLEKNVILIGGSTTREGVLPNYSLSNNWRLYNFALSGNSVYSDKVMLNYINNYGNHQLNKNDVVILHIWYAYFVENPPKSSYTRSMIESSGNYRVDDSGIITGQMTDLQKKLLLQKQHIRFFYINSLSEMDQTIRNIFIPIQDTPDEEKLKIYAERWSKYTRNTKYPNNSTAEFQELIRQLQNQTNVVVVNLYTPSWIRSYSQEQEYEKWLETNLTPFLKTEDILYLDFSLTSLDSDYADSAHLLINGRKNYTVSFDKEINKYLENISTSR